MKGERVKLSRLIKEVIQEIGDLKNIEPYKYIKDKFELDTGELVTVNFQEIYKKDEDLDYGKIPDLFNTDTRIFNIGYFVNGLDTQTLKSTPKVLFKILKTVSIIVSNKIKELEKVGENPLFLVGAQSKTSDIYGIQDTQKLRLYKQVLYSGLPKGYRMQTVENLAEGYDLIVIQKNK